MTLSFENESDVLIFAFERLINYARINQYLFVANCVLWIVNVMGLDEALRNYIDTLELNNRIQVRGISTTPRDIARSVSPANNTTRNYLPNPLTRTQIDRIDPLPQTIRQLKSKSVSPANITTRNYIPDPLRRTRAGKINPLPQTKKQLKKARKEKRNRIYSSGSKN